MTVAALFVAEGGCYTNLAGVEAWTIARDARAYAGPWPVVAHPPCERWGRFWFGGPQWLKDGKPRKALGDDGGCFASALEAVRTWGGVLEHPKDSHAWRVHGLRAPSRAGGWDGAGDFRGFTCCVDQGHYGHRAQKATWLYAVGTDLPSLTWGKSDRRVRLDEGYHSAEERRRKVRTGTCQRLSKRERSATPLPFRDLLLGIARSVHIQAA